MNKKWTITILLGIFIFLLTGCDMAGAKTASMSYVYGLLGLTALVMLGIYCLVVKKKELWFLLLFSSIFVVNAGYFALSISKNLEEALLANRISYLGSVFLPMSMFMLVINACRMNYKKWLPGLLVTISIIVFFIAASQGYLDIYYKEVEFVLIDGVGGLKKVYGSWHKIYLLYLMIYFGAMVMMILYASFKKRLRSKVHAVVLTGAVWINIVVWFVEQLVHFDFEMLSVSYIISEFFLICFCSIGQEREETEYGVSEGDRNNGWKIENNGKHENKETINESILGTNGVDTQEQQNEVIKADEEKVALFVRGLSNLTTTEEKIYHLYLEI